MKRVFWGSLFLTLALSGTIYSQQCVIGQTRFACPKYFKKIESLDRNTLLFKYNKAASSLHLFVTTPNGDFDPEAIGLLVLGRQSNVTADTFKWKSVQDPLVMDTDTKHKYDVIGGMGLGPTRLFEVKGFVFDLKGKRLVIGYVSDWSEDRATNKRRYDEGKGFGDNASGCNAVVSVLNSITKEFKEKDQHCTLTGFSVPTN